MSQDAVISILEEIRDQQKLQIAKFERALTQQDEAMDLQKRGRKVFLFLVFMPWLVLVVVFLLMLVNPGFLS